jgi:hypothetical protein
MPKTCTYSITACRKHALRGTADSCVQICLNVQGKASTLRPEGWKNAGLSVRSKKNMTRTNWTSAKSMIYGVIASARHRHMVGLLSRGIRDLTAPCSPVNDSTPPDS